MIGGSALLTGGGQYGGRCQFQPFPQQKMTVISELSANYVN